MSTGDREGLSWSGLLGVSDILAWKMLSDCSQINLDNVVQSKVTDTLRHSHNTSRDLWHSKEGSVGSHKMAQFLILDTQASSKTAKN